MELGDARKKAFEILPKESIRTIGEKMIKKHKPKRKQLIMWQERDMAVARYIYCIPKSNHFFKKGRPVLNYSAK